MKYNFFTLFVAITTIFIILFPNIAQAQPRNMFVQYYRFENDYPVRFYDIYSLDNGYAICGMTRRSSWLVITSPDGGLISQRSYFPEGENVLRSLSRTLIEADDSGFVLGGYIELRTGAGSTRNFSILKTDDNYEIEWWRNFDEGELWGECMAVIELKSDELLGAGPSNNSAYAVKLEMDGEIIWEHHYENAGYFRSIREVDGGYLFAGGSDLIQTNEDGEVTWHREVNGQVYSLISCRRGGYAVCGESSEGNRNHFWLSRLDNEGRQTWEHSYQIFEGRNSWAYSLTQMPDDGFMLVGGWSLHDYAKIIRTDMGGEEMWRREDAQRGIENTNGNAYASVVTDNDGFALVAGSTYFRNGDHNGVLVKIVPERSAPAIFFYTPEELEFNVLQNDTVFFAVQAMDFQDDSLSYVWTVDDDTISVDTSRTIVFDELGEKTVRCIVSDEELSDSLQWTVHVNEFYIEAFQPDSLDLIIRRGNTVDFSLGVRSLEDVEVEYSWTFIDRNQRMHQLDAESDSISFEFEFAGDQAIIGEVTRGEVSHDLRWNVQVRSNVWYWWPHELVMSVPEDTMMEFKVFPFEDEEDSLELEYSWFLDGNGVDADSNVIELRMSDIGAHVVSALVSDSLEADTIVWELDVYDPAGISDRIGSLLPVEAILYPTSPNPFNSKVNLSFHLPQPEFGELTIYDLSGRKVQDIFRGRASSGKTSFTWDATFRPAGVYLVEFRTSSTTYVRKIILLR